MNETGLLDPLVTLSLVKVTGDDLVNCRDCICRICETFLPTEVT